MDSIIIFKVSQISKNNNFYYYLNTLKIFNILIDNLNLTHKNFITLINNLYITYN